VLVLIYLDYSILVQLFDLELGVRVCDSGSTLFVGHVGVIVCVYAC